MCETDRKKSRHPAALAAVLILMQILAGCANNSKNPVTDPSKPDVSGTTQTQNTPDTVRYTNASGELIEIAPIPVTAMPAGEEEQLDWSLMILGQVYRNYSIVDSWFVRPPGDLVVDASDAASVDGYLPVKSIGNSEILPYQTINLALKVVFGGKDYAPEQYDMALFKDVDGKLYVRKNAPRADYTYLPDINYAAVTDITPNLIIFQAPVIDQQNQTCGTVTITVSGEGGVWRFVGDIHREYELNS